MEYKYDVFISYSRKDSIIANEIYQLFERKNISCFIDKELIRGGDDFAKKITDAILSSRIFLFLASKNSYKSRFSINEVKFFTDRISRDKDLERDRVFIPYMIDDSPIPNELDYMIGTTNRLNIHEHPIDGILVRNILEILYLYPTSKVKSITEQTPDDEHSFLPKYPDNNLLSYFTGEQHSENFEQIVRIAEGLGYSVRIYESKDSSQFDFIQAVYRDAVTIVDVTVPDDMTLSTVYPILTAHINILNHILVFSDKQYKDTNQVLPLNITPQRKRTNDDRDLLGWMIVQLKELKGLSYERFEIESVEKLADYKDRMEAVMTASLNIHNSQKDEHKNTDKKRVMISYRNSCSKEVELFRKREEAKGEVEIKVLPPGSLCDDYEAHTPMRRWMLVGLLEDHIRSVNEVWVYYNDIYINSWWTLAEMVMVAYINYDRAEKDKVKVKMYDAGKKRFLEENEKGYPAYLHIQLSNIQYQKLARYLSNTRPDTMGPETLHQIDGLKRMARVMRFMTKKKRSFISEQMRPMIEQGVPSDISQEERDKMVSDLLAMYSDPKAIMTYANDAVFKGEFWNNISYQTERVTAAFKDGAVDVDIFMETPMKELTKLKDENLRIAVDSSSQIKLKGKKYYVGEGKQRYLWLATRMGMPTVKDAPGIEIIQTYNLLTHDQIVGMVMKNLL